MADQLDAGWVVWPPTCKTARSRVLAGEVVAAGAPIEVAGCGGVAEAQSDATVQPFQVNRSIHGGERCVFERGPSSIWRDLDGLRR